MVRFRWSYWKLVLKSFQQRHLPVTDLYKWCPSGFVEADIQILSLCLCNVFYSESLCIADIRVSFHKHQGILHCAHESCSLCLWYKNAQGIFFIEICNVESRALTPVFDINAVYKACYHFTFYILVRMYVAKKNNYTSRLCKSVKYILTKKAVVATFK